MTECKHFNREEIHLDEDDVEICNMMKCLDCTKILYNNRHKWNLTVNSISVIQDIYATISFESYSKILELLCLNCTARAETRITMDEPYLKNRNCS